MYTQDDPKWVRATSARYATADQRYVTVVAYDATFELCLVEWSDPLFNKSQSDVLVQNSRGDWLRVWFVDADVLPYQPEAQP